MTVLDVALMWLGAGAWGAYCGWTEKGTLAALVGSGGIAFVYITAKSFL